ncbi:MAG: hypothetical protein ACRC9W_04945, partial [Plesiomonas sp.]
MGLPSVSPLVIDVHRSSVPLLISMAGNGKKQNGNVPILELSSHESGFFTQTRVICFTIRNKAQWWWMVHMPAQFD